MSWGLRQAGFRILAGVDQDPVALATFARNVPEAKALRLDLGAISPAELLGAIGRRPDVLVGGPPCQGFSKNVPRNVRFLEDPRNLLVRAFMDAVRALEPKVVLMENVAEMANAFDGALRDELVAFLRRAGYETTFRVHNAAEYGVPQHRRRVLFLSSRTGGELELPAPRCRLRGGKRMVTITREAVPGIVPVWDAIGDLAPVRELGPRPNAYATSPSNEFQRLMRRDVAELTDHEERRLRPGQQARYDALEPGQAIRDLPPALRPRSGYSGAYGRLTREMLAPTITRCVFHPGSGRFGHPVERRLLTIREAARLQSFSDDFVFAGTNQQKSAQIGNAVPPVLMHALAPAIRAALRSSSGKRRGPALARGASG
jgi:DNA (cytosine-5)-methyltransferase 1